MVFLTQMRKPSWLRIAVKAQSSLLMAIMALRGLIGATSFGFFAQLQFVSPKLDFCVDVKKCERFENYDGCQPPEA
jgi:hypothetical protein